MLLTIPLVVEGRAVKFLITTLVLLITVGASIKPADCNFPVMKPVSIQKYKVPISLVKDAWLSLDVIPQATSADTTKIRSHLKEALVTLYEAEHKSATANSIARLDSVVLSKELQRQRKEKSDFIPGPGMIYELASIRADGTLYLTKRACTALFVSPESPNYKAFLTAVGKIEPGYVKEIMPISKELVAAEYSYRRKASTSQQQN